MRPSASSYGCQAPTLDFGLQPADFRLGLVKEQPTLETDRLLLRPLVLQDDLFVRELANNPKTDSMNIWPLHGYGRKTARHWIGLKRVAWKDGTAAEFGIELKSGGELLGLVGLDSIDAAHAPAELSFLLHERFWGQGCATEAATRWARSIASETGEGMRQLEICPQQPEEARKGGRRTSSYCPSIVGQVAGNLARCSRGRDLGLD